VYSHGSKIVSHPDEAHALRISGDAREDKTTVSPRPIHHLGNLDRRRK
jgi:hypothetical protein